MPPEAGPCKARLGGPRGDRHPRDREEIAAVERGEGEEGRLTGGNPAPPFTCKGLCDMVCDPVGEPTPSNLAIDDRLLEEALRVGGHRTKRETVNEALGEYIQRRRQLQVIDHLGTIDFDDAFDHKVAR